ncbi:phage integrase family protein [Paraburkholderia tropica]|uniref:phage integrase family protein n=1 Tax=Paraburkholderia tropica TaxID=92647 RepID=UPI003B8A77CA
MHSYGITTLANLTVRIPRRRRWRKVVRRLGAASAAIDRQTTTAWPFIYLIQ